MSLARMVWAGLVQTNGFEDVLCSLDVAADGVFEVGDGFVCG